MSEIYLENGLYWKGWNDSAMDAWSTIVLHSILCVIILVLIVICFRMFLCQKNISHDNKLLRILLVISLVFTFLYIYSTYFIACFIILVFNIRYHYHCLYRILCGSFYSFQRVTVYTFMVIRLQRSFRGTVFEFNKIKSKILIFLILCASVMQLCILTYFAASKGSFQCHLNGVPHIKIAIVFGVAGDVIISSMITYVFVWRLKAIFNSKLRKTDALTSKVKYLFQKFTILSYVCFI